MSDSSFEALSRDECFRLLRAEVVGRVAVVIGSQPMIFPVNYTLAGETIVFRTDEGTKLAGMRPTFRVAFEIDGIDPTYHTGWSVLVSGYGREIVDRHELDALATLPVRPWAPGPRDHWVRIEPITATGRRIVTTGD